MFLQRSCEMSQSLFEPRMNQWLGPFERVLMLLWLTVFGRCTQRPLASSTLDETELADSGSWPDQGGCPNLSVCPGNKSGQFCTHHNHTEWTAPELFDIVWGSCLSLSLVLLQKRAPQPAAKLPGTPLQFQAFLSSFRSMLQLLGWADIRWSSMLLLGLRWALESPRVSSFYQSSLIHVGQHLLQGNLELLHRISEPSSSQWVQLILPTSVPLCCRSTTSLVDDKSRFQPIPLMV